MKNQIILFTDGSSRGNPGPGGWGAIAVFGEGPAGRVKELGGREAITTNNRMELMAAIGGLRIVRADRKDASVHIHTDSQYLINGITKWVAGWKKRGWKTVQKQDVLNRDLWEALSELVDEISPRWDYIEGHAGIPANERCDEIATGFADGLAPALYEGSLAGYAVDTKTIRSTAAGARAKAATKSSKHRSGAKAFSYVSLVKGIFMRHATWAECEARVKGVAGARYKKAFSAEDERTIASEWGA